MEEPREVIKGEIGLDLVDIIFTPGRTDYSGKGLDILLKAYNNYRSTVPNPPTLVLVGPKGEGHDHVIADIEKMALGDRVFCFGRVSDR